MAWNATPDRFISFKLEHYAQLPEPATRGAQASPIGGLPQFWPDLQQNYPELEFRPLITSLPPHEVFDLQQAARQNDPTYEGEDDLRTFFTATFPADANLDVLLCRLAAEANVTAVEVLTTGRDPQPQGSSGDAQTAALAGARKAQYYLAASPRGIGAAIAAKRYSATGKKVALCDLERGWTINHIDLRAKLVENPVPLIGKIRKRSRHHGTAVLGIICAADDGAGYVGIAPKIDRVYVASRHKAPVADAIAAAVDAKASRLKAGDVILLEVQNGSKGKETPVELHRGTWEAIRAASALGIVVVECAGNGGRNLNGFKRLNRKSGKFKDSGAIMVASAHWSKAKKSWSRRGSSNRGNRIDCFAEGKGVATISSDDNGSTTRYTAKFSGTSAAAAIIAGAAVALQSVVVANGHAPLTSLQMRAALTHEDGSIVGTSKKMGRMPDLEILAKMAARGDL